MDSKLIGVGDERVLVTDFAALRLAAVDFIGTAPMPGFHLPMLHVALNNGDDLFFNILPAEQLTPMRNALIDAVLNTVDEVPHDWARLPNGELARRSAVLAVQALDAVTDPRILVVGRTFRTTVVFAQPMPVAEAYTAVRNIIWGNL